MSKTEKSETSEKRILDQSSDEQLPQPKAELDEDTISIRKEKSRPKAEPRPEAIAANSSTDVNIFKERGRSTIGESLPDNISVGSFTALNTDRFTYYSFYARVDELIHFRWESRVNQVINEYDRSRQIEKIRGQNWVTEYEFWLDRTGRLHSAHLLKESGIKRFDAAAEFAFRDALVFPNPPKDMIDSDGFVRLRYSFTIRGRSVY